MGSVVAIVGRPNVGKSTLFNRLAGERKAIVDDQSGVTRDRHYSLAEWQGKEFTLIDTGGYVKGTEDVFEKEIRRQVSIAIEESDVLIFMVDTTEGVHPLDEEVADLLRRSRKPVLIVTNKVDHFGRIPETAEFYRLGFEEIFPISSLSGSGTGELLDRICQLITDAPENTNTLPKIAIIGKPNVGKSSLTNALLGEDRNIVTNIPGTTRDSIHAHYKSFGHEFLLIDTAGVRKKNVVREDIEFYSVMRAIKAIEESDVILLMIDASEGFQSQDQNLFHLAEKNGKGIVILVNKWDLVIKDHQTAKAYTEAIKEKIAPFRDVPILFISVLEKQRIFQAMEMAIKVFEKRNQRIPTHALNEFILPIMVETPPPSVKGKYIKIKYVTQLRTNPRHYLFFCNLPQYVREEYKRFLENQIRKQFDLSGVPLKFFFRKK